MRGRAADAVRSLTAEIKPGFRGLVHRPQRRCVQISTNLSNVTPPAEQLPNNVLSTDSDGPDAKFEVLGAPYSLLSVSLSASQTLYTRRGTLVGVSGKADNAISTLSTLEPLSRAVLGIPFFYQKISSASPIIALLSTKSPLTSFTVVHLDGTTDWLVAQKRALLAWTGQTLSISPTVNTDLAVTNWGNSRVTGRGLLALVGQGQVYQILLKAGESYIAHPSNVLAYDIAKHKPTPYRFRSSVLQIQVPGLGYFENLLPDIKFFRNMRESTTWKVLARLLFNMRTWSRRTIFGDRLFLQFQGPATILLQTRASRISDVLTAREINEIADSPAGAIHSAIALDGEQERQKLKESTGVLSPSPPLSPSPSSTGMSYASVGGDGKVKFEQKA